MVRPEIMRDCVREALERHANRHKMTEEQKEALIRDIEWDTIMGCYYFVQGGMYYGLEINGYLHT